MHLSLVVPLLFAAAPSPATVSPALVAARSIEQPYLSPSISFDDVEIGTVRRRLANLGLEIPIQLEGQVNVSLTVGIPLGTFGSAETYRINGYLRSQRLVVEGVELLDFDATIRYRDGVMSLSPLVFRIAEEGAQPQTAGQFRGTAALELVPLEDVSIRVAVETIPVAPLTKQIAALPEISGGTFSGNLQATSPVRQVADVTFWTGDARLSLADWRAAGRTLERAEAAFTLANGTVNIERIAGSLEGFTLAGQGKLALVGGQSFEGTAGVGTDSIQNFGRLLPTVAIPESISAAPQVEATFQGTLNPLRYEVSGQAAVRELVVRPPGGGPPVLEVPAATLAYSLAPERLRLTNPQITLRQGRFTGTLEAEATLDRLTDPAAWAATADIRLENWPLRWRDAVVELQSAAFEGRLAEGTARANRLELVLDGLRAEGSGTATLRAPFQFQSQAQLNAPDLSRFAELAEALLGLEGLAGRAEFSADADGTLEPLDFAASGSAGVASLQLAGLTVDSFRTQYALEETRLRLSELAVELYGGRAAGEAVAPLEPNVPGSADLKWSGIDAGRIAADVLDLPWDVRGETAGSVELTLPAAGESGRRDWTLAASFDVPELQVESIVLGEIHGSASRRDGVIDYEVAASLLGGTLDLDGRWAPGAEDRTVDEGRLVLQNVKLDRLAAAASEARGAAPLGGTVALRANYTHMAADGLPAGRGTAAVSDLTWRNARLSERVEAVARWDGAHVVLESISGAAFGGSLAGQAVVNLDRKRPATFALRLRSGELERALAAWPEAAQNVSGPFELSLRGAVGERISAVASVTSTRPTVAGLRLSRLRLPVRIESGLPGEGRTVLRVHSAAAGAAHGRVTGNLRVTAGRRFDIKGDVKFDQLDTGSLVPRGGSGLGRLSGSMTIEGRRVTSIDDLSGRIDARLGRTRPRDLPLMAELQPYLGSRFSQGDVADAGSLRARFRRGTLSIERFSLDGDTFDVYADGTVHRSGRLDLDVAARTGQQTGAGGPLGAFLLERFPLAGATPVGLALQANRFVSERVVYLRVTGTVQRPAVSVQTGRVLQDEALRFFLQNIR